MERTLTIRTGWGGMDMLNEMIQKSGGYMRVYVGKKVPRILRKLKNLNLHKHRTRGYYRVIKDPNFVEENTMNMKDYIAPNYEDFDFIKMQETIRRAMFEMTGIPAERQGFIGIGDILDNMK